MDRKNRPQNSMLWRLIVVGVVACLMGWACNELAVYALERYEPPAGDGISLPDFGLDDSTRDDSARRVDAPGPERRLADGGGDDPAPASPKQAAEDGDKPPPAREDKGVAKRAPPDESEEDSSKEKGDSAEADADDDGPTVHRFAVDEDALSSRVDGLEDLADHGRMAPHYIDGERRGIKLIDIAPGGVFDQLGVVSGDVIRSVNGKTIDTQRDALDAVDKMRDERVFDVLLDRGDERRHHRYVVQ